MLSKETSSTSLWYVSIEVKPRSSRPLANYQSILAIYIYIYIYIYIAKMVRGFTSGLDIYIYIYIYIYGWIKSFAWVFRTQGEIMKGYFTMSSFRMIEPSMPICILRSCCRCIALFSENRQHWLTATVHNARTTRNKLQGLERIELIPHPSDRPVLTPSDYSLFWSNQEEAEASVKEFFNWKDKNWYQQEIKKLAGRWILLCMTDFVVVWRIKWGILMV